LLEGHLITDFHIPKFPLIDCREVIRIMFLTREHNARAST